MVGRNRRGVHLGRDCLLSLRRLRKLRLRRMAARSRRPGNRPRRAFTICATAAAHCSPARACMLGPSPRSLDTHTAPNDRALHARHAGDGHRRCRANGEGPEDSWDKRPTDVKPQYPTLPKHEARMFPVLLEKVDEILRVTAHEVNQEGWRRGDPPAYRVLHEPPQ
jgi:hypothetical protein